MSKSSISLSTSYLRQRLCPVQVEPGHKASGGRFVPGQGASHLYVATCKAVSRWPVCSSLRRRYSAHRSRYENRPRRVRSCYWNLKAWKLPVEGLGFNTLYDGER
jgi:hypothetical protein